MIKLKCLLVDDEPPAIEILKQYVSAVPSLEIAGECKHGIDAFSFLQQNKVDLLFLDINMPQLSGMELIRSLPHPPKVIFTTAHREYAADGFDVNAIDYLLKPFSMDRFLKAIHKAQTNESAIVHKEEFQNNDSERFLYFRSDRKMVKVMVHNIRYIESLKDYVRIFHETNPLVTKQTITAVEDMLPIDQFIRVHRSFIVALDKITSYNQQALYIGSEEIPIGPLYRNEVIRRLSLK